MAHDDGTEAKVAATAALTAVVFSPRVRDVLRRGAVYGLAGVLTAGDTLWAFARGVSRGVRASMAPATRGEPAPADVSVDRGPGDSAVAGGTVASDGAPRRPPRRARRRPPAASQSERGSSAAAPASTTASAKVAADDAPDE